MERESINPTNKGREMSNKKKKEKKNFVQGKSINLDLHIQQQQQQQQPTIRALIFTTLATEPSSHSSDLSHTYLKSISIVSHSKNTPYNCKNNHY